MKQIERAKQQIALSVKSNFDLGNWNASDRPGNISSTRTYGVSRYVPGTRINWDAAAGEVLSCPAVQACFNVIWRNLPQAITTLEKKAAAEWKAVPDHPLLDFMERPNPSYDGATLRNMMAYSLFTNGNGFAEIVRTGGGTPAQQWWIPSNRITVAPDQVLKDPIEEWVVTDPNGYRRTVDASNIIHLKQGLHPDDPRFGLATLFSGARSAYTLQLATTYRANILRNFGVMGKMVSPKDPNISLDPIVVKDLIDNATRGDQVGSTVVVETALDVTTFGTSPKEMALDTYEDRDESLICALFGVPPQVALLLVGRLMKTDANWKEAREQFWEDCLMPLLSLLMGQYYHRMYPEFSLTRDPLQLQREMAGYRLTNDFSDIRALQPDLDKEHTRLREDWKVNLIDREQWKQAVGMVALPEDKGLYFTDTQPVPVAPTKPQDGTQNGTGGATSGKGYDLTELREDWAGRVSEEMLKAEEYAPSLRNGVH